MNQMTRLPVDFQPGDLVLILEKKTRGRWPLGRVVKAHETPRDGIVRQLTVDIGGKLMTKPTHEVLRLQLFESQDGISVSYTHLTLPTIYSV